MIIDDFYKQLEEVTKTGAVPRTIQSGQGPYLTIEGVKKLNFCSSHYLGFTEEPRIRNATIEAVKKYGIGTGYRTLAGTHVLHLELEEAIAKFKCTEAALVFTSAYLANCSAVQTFIGKEDIVISDELNHASIIDAIRLSQVQNKFIYKHADTNDLEEKLKEASKIMQTPKSDGQLPVVLIITDGVFSMDGDLAPLPKIVELAKKYGALTMVDDAHGEGVLGNGGRGIVDHFGLIGKIDIEVGSLSKAFSSCGGYIAANKTIVKYQKLKSRQRLFSISLSIPDSAASLEGIKILLESDKPVKKLWENVNYLRSEFKRLGFDTGHSESPIIPVMLGDEELAKTFSAKLFEENVFATPILFPMVAKGKARIRVIPSAAHSKEDLDLGIRAFTKVAKELKVL
jgi:glycine C-acetyltransferase